MLTSTFQYRTRSRLSCPDCNCVWESDNYAISWKACLLPNILAELSTEDCLSAFLSKERVEWKCTIGGVSAMARREISFVTTPTGVDDVPDAMQHSNAH